MRCFSVMLYTCGLLFFLLLFHVPFDVRSICLFAYPSVAIDMYLVVHVPLYATYVICYLNTDLY